MTPSNMSGALPRTTASTSFHSSSASASARSAASRTRPAMLTSLRALTCLVCPVPRTAARFPLTVPPPRKDSGSLRSLASLQDCDEVLLQARATGRVRHRVPGLTRLDPRERLTEALKTGDHHGVRRQCTTRRVDVGARLVDAEGVEEDQLLGAEGRVQLGKI